MAKNKTLLAPLVVGKDSLGNDVTLSHSKQVTLNKIVDVAARAQLQATFTAEAMKAAEGRARYLNGRNVMEIEATEKGFARVKGTGTSNWAHFSKQQGLELISRFEEFKAVVNSLPEKE